MYACSRHAQGFRKPRVRLNMPASGDSAFLETIGPRHARRAACNLCLIPAPIRSVNKSREYCWWGCRYRTFRGLLDKSGHLHQRFLPFSPSPKSQEFLVLHDEPEMERQAESQRGRIIGSCVAIFIITDIFVLLRLVSRKLARAGYWVRSLRDEVVMVQTRMLMVVLLVG